VQERVKFDLISSSKGNSYATAMNFRTETHICPMFVMMMLLGVSTVPVYTSSTLSSLIHRVVQGILSW